MIHKILFSLITVFWILGISQGYVLQGQDDDFIEITVTFDERNRLDIKDMMEQAGYEDRGDFLQLIQDITGEENWDRNLDNGDKFFIPKPVSETEIELAPPDYGDAESEMQLPVQLMPKQVEYKPTYGSTYKRVMERGYVICGTKENFAGFSEKKFIDVVSNLTIYVESKDREGNYLNVFLKDKLNDDQSQVIYAKRGKIVNINNINYLILNNGKFIDIDKNKITTFEFKKTEFDLSKYVTKSTTFPKVQEIPSSHLFKCFKTLILNNINEQNYKQILAR